MAQRGLLDTLTDTMQSPLFLGGASLLSGGGFGGAIQGMNAGNRFQMQRRAMEEQAQRRAAYDDLLQNLPQGINPAIGRLAQVAGPEAGLPMLAGALPKPISQMEQDMQRARLDLMRAQAARANRPDQGPDAPSNVREWQYYQSLPKEQQAEYLRLRRPSENRVVGDSIINRGTGEVVSNVGDQLQAGEMRKVQGKNDADFAKAFPKVQQSFRMFDDKSRRLEETIDRAITRIGPLTTGAGAVLANLPATEARALRGDLDTIRANVGFEELQAMRDASPTGGALGQVSEMENRLLQSIRAAIDQFLAGKNLKTNLMIIKDSVRQLREMKRQAYEADAARMGGSQAPPAVQMGQPQQRRTIDAGDGFTVEY